MSQPQMLSVPVSAITVKQNVRKTFDKAEAAELEASIAAHGILQPLLLRPGKKAGSYVLAAGERRLRAALAVGLEEVPAIIWTMDEGQARIAQAVENLQRSDLHPMEEAEGLELLGLSRTVEELARAVNKSVPYVRRRLQLLSLPGPARNAFKAGRMDLRTALLVARIPDSRLAAQVFRELDQKWKGEEIPYGPAREEVERHTLRLALAPFSLEDAELLRDAGPCTSCPKRSGNAPDLFGDLEDGDRCTDPRCYRAKVAAQWKRTKRDNPRALEGTAGEAAGQEASFYGRKWLNGSSRITTGGKQRKVRDLLGKDGAEIVVPVLRKAGRIEELYPKAEALRVIKARGHDLLSSRPKNPKTAEREKRARLELKARRDSVGLALASLRAADVSAVPAVDFWQALALTVARGASAEAAKLLAEERNLPKPADDAPEVEAWEAEDEASPDFERADPRTPRGRLEAEVRRITTEAPAENQWNDLALLAVEILAADNAVRSYYDGEEAMAGYGQALRGFCAVFGVDLLTIHGRTLGLLEAQAADRAGRRKGKKAPTAKKAARKKTKGKAKKKAARKGGRKK